MHSELKVFVGRHKPFFETSVSWGQGALLLRECHYLSHELPPLEYVTSVRSLIFRNDTVLVVRNRDGWHALPGGRQEEGETLESTLHREIKEETGWLISRVSLLGFAHFHHLQPKPPGYRYPYPDFLQLVYQAEANELHEELKLPEDYEVEARFCSFTEVEKYDASVHVQRYLEAAIAARCFPP